MVSTGWQQENLVQIDLLKLGSENHREMLASDAFPGPGRIFGAGKKVPIWIFKKVLVKFASETGPFFGQKLTPAFGSIRQGVFVAQAPGISRQFHWPRKK